jgi:hypothetical protein
MTDDDIFNEIFLDDFFNITRNNIYDLYVLNANIYDSNMSFVIKNLAFRINSSKNLIKLSKNIFESHDINNCINHLSFIGSIIIKKSLLLENNDKQFYDTFFNHIYTLTNANIKKLLIINLPIIKIRAGNANWTYKSFQIWNYYWPNVVNYSKYNDLRKTEIKISFRSVLYYYAIGSIQKNNIFKLKINFVKKIPLYIILILIKKTHLKLFLYYFFILKNFNVNNEQSYYIKQSILNNK